MPAPVYPLALPSTPHFTDFDLSRDTATAITESGFSGDQFVMENDYSIWHGIAKLPPMTYDQAKPWIVFFALLEGVLGTFKMRIHPDFPPSEMSADGTVRTAANAGSYDVSVSVPTGTTGDVSPGEYISIGSGASEKLHVITASSRVGNSLNFTLTLKPTLRMNVSVGTAVNFRNPQGIFRMTSNTDKHSTNKIGAFGFRFAFREAV